MNIHGGPGLNIFALFNWTSKNVLCFRKGRNNHKLISSVINEKSSSMKGIFAIISRYRCALIETKFAPIMGEYSYKSERLIC